MKSAEGAEAELLLESLERLGYVRCAARSVTAAREQDWLLVCDTRAMTLAPAFGRFAVDPTNTLLGGGFAGAGSRLQTVVGRRLAQRAARSGARFEK